MKRGWIQPLFYVSALYDGLIGLAFLFFWRDIVQRFNVTPPNHGGYVQFPALLLIIFAAMFIQIARNPVKNRDLIPYGIALKVAYTGVVFYYELKTGIPQLWVWFAWADLAFLILFILAYQSLRSTTAR